MTMIERDVWQEVDERRRTYHYANEGTLTVEGVRRILVSKNGTHYLETNENDLH